MYRDLKPENLLLDADGHIKICDFGLSKEEVSDDTVKSICGTPEYLAPEVIQRKTYGKAVDWWSLGTLVYEMIHGLPPFYDVNRQSMYHKILEAPLTRPKHMSADAFEVCEGLLTREPTMRLGYNGATEIKEKLWFKSNDWEAILNKQVTAPFQPRVKDEKDTSKIDPEFLGETPMVTPTPMNPVIVNEQFDNFTYDDRQ